MLKAKALFAVKENENTEQKPIDPAANNPGQNPAADPEQTTAAAEQEKKSAALAALEPEREFVARIVTNLEKKHSAPAPEKPEKVTGIRDLVGRKQNMIIESYGDENTVPEWITSLAVKLVENDALIKDLILRLRQQYIHKQKEFSFSLSAWGEKDKRTIRTLFKEEMCGLVESVSAEENSDILSGNLVLTPEAQQFLTGQYMEIGVYEMIREILDELAAQHGRTYRLYRNVVVSTKAGLPENEFDIVIEWDGILYVIEVKSGKKFEAWGTLAGTGKKYGIVPDRLLLVDSYLSDVKARRIESFCRYYVSSLEKESLKEKVTRMISNDL